MTRGLWFHSVEDHLYKSNPSYRTICEKGFAIIKGTVCVVCPRHAAMVKLDTLASINIATNYSFK